MYLSINVENMVTIGIMLLGWILFIHILAQVGVNLGQYVGVNA